MVSRVVKKNFGLKMRLLEYRTLAKLPNLMKKKNVGGVAFGSIVKQAAYI